MSRRMLVSIHDVMPDTLNQVRHLFDELVRQELTPVSLLVVPGCDWRTQDLEALRQMAGAGAELAGHGWTHEAGRIRGLRHRLHSLLISRNAAEHLSLDRRGVLRLMQDCHDWFSRHGLPAPSLYVPPAWALGDVCGADLRTLPYACVETLGGVHTPASRCFHRLPMVGYEADTRLRAAAVRIWNSVNLQWAAMGGTLRLGIHPGDPDLYLAQDLKQLIAEGGTALSYRELAPR